MAALDNIASELLKSANEADLIYKKTRDQAQRDKAVRLRRIVENLRQLVFGASDLNGLSDVTISAPANAQVLTYNSTTSQWENQTPGSGSGIGDMSKSTYDVDNDGVVDGAETIQIIVRNSTGSTLTKGQVVYLSGATGNRPNAVLSKADTEATSSKTIGIVVANIANNSDGYVAVSGTLHDLDTSAFADGAAVWLSATTAGAYTSTIPAEPNHTVFVGYIARSHPTQGRLVILIQNGYELNELHGVLISAEANNDLLVYESSSTLWKNKSISAIFGGTPLVSVPTLAQVTTAGNTTTNAVTVGGVKSTADYELRVDNGAANVRIGRFKFIRGTYDPTGVGASIDFWRDGAAYGGVLAFSTNPGTAGDNAAERMRITTGGNILIGTTTDAGYKLDVQGQGYFSSGIVTNTAIALRLIASSGILNDATEFRTGGGEFKIFSGRVSGAHQAIVFATGDNYTSGATRMVITAAGNVGINTTSPGEKLQVAGNLHISGVGSALYFDTDASPKSIVQYVNNLYELHIYNGRGITSRIIGGTNFVSLGSGTTQMFYLNTSSTRVGIGTTSPTRKLTVIDTTTGAGLAIDSSTQSDNFYIEASKAGSLRFSVYENSDVVYVNSYGRMVFRANQLGGTTGFFGFLGGNLLINTSTDSGYKLNVNGTAFIGGVATLNSDANIAGNVSTPQITARRYYQNPNGVPSNNLGDPTVTEMALFDEQFDNKTAFYPAVYGSSILTFETYNGTTWTDISSTLTDTQKRQLFGGDNVSSIAIPYGTVQYQITINNPGPYVYLNALYTYWSGNGHSTQVHIWKKHNSGSWVQHTNSTTAVSSWPGHLYLPFSTIAWHPAGTLGTHYNQVRVVFTPTWNATFPTNNISLYKTQWWGGYPAGKRVIYSTDENRNVVFPTNLSASGAITASGTITASGGTSTNWNTAFGWGNHASAGYVTSSGTVANSTNSTNTTNVASGAIADLNAAWTAPGTSIGNGFRVHNYIASATNKPVSNDNANWLLNIYSHPSGGTASYGHQIAAANADNIYFRSVSNGSFGTWRTLFHSGNSPTLGQVTSAGNSTSNTITVGKLNAYTSAAPSTYVSMVSLDETTNNGDTHFGLDWRAAGASGFPWGSTSRISSLRDASNSTFSLLFHTMNSTALAERMRITGNGNLLINTTTNAGYKLDVNGTARIQSDLTVASLTTDGPVKSLSGMLVSVAGYTGSFTVPTNPPGMQTLDIQDGIIVNIL